MSWESFDVITFDLGPLLQGQTTAKLINAYKFRNLQPLCRLLLLLHVCYVRGYTARNKASGISLVLTGIFICKLLSGVYTMELFDLGPIYKIKKRLPE